MDKRTTGNKSRQKPKMGNKIVTLKGKEIDQTCEVVQVDDLEQVPQCFSPPAIAPEGDFLVENIRYNLYNNAARWKDTRELSTLIDEYFQKCDNSYEMPSVVGLAIYLNMLKDAILEYIRDYEEDCKLPVDEKVISEFRRSCGGILKKARDDMERYVIRLAAAAKNPAFFIFFMKNEHKYSDKVEQINTNQGDFKIKIEVK